jgi:hypothetical protein
MVRKGGLEPPRLSAPPPQDGVSANSTTSALYSTGSKNQTNPLKRRDRLVWFFIHFRGPQALTDNLDKCYSGLDICQRLIANRLFLSNLPRKPSRMYPFLSPVPSTQSLYRSWREVQGATMHGVEMKLKQASTVLGVPPKELQNLVQFGVLRPKWRARLLLRRKCSATG